MLAALNFQSSLLLCILFLGMLDALLLSFPKAGQIVCAGLGIK